MFGWRTQADRDAVAAARRRLAAIAAQFAISDESASEADGAIDGDPADARLAPVAGHPVGAESASAGAPTQSGRHAGRTADHDAGSRWALSAHQVAVICLATVAMVMVAAWWVLRSVPHSQPIQLSSERSVPAGGATDYVATTPVGGVTGSPPTVASAGSSASDQPGAAAQSSASSSAEIVVDVAGKVRRPGIVELPSGSRVVDALDAAGGPRPGVDTRSLNLARPLVDGEQIVVGYAMPVIGGGAATGAPSASAPTSAGQGPTQRVDLNTATAEELDTLPDIGPVTAQSILTWRQQNGAFTSVDELLEVSGIGDATLADVAPYVYV